jgi:hypothetical protein
MDEELRKGQEVCSIMVLVKEWSGSSVLVLQGASEKFLLIEGTIQFSLDNYSCLGVISS